MAPSSPHTPAPATGTKSGSKSNSLIRRATTHKVKRLTQQVRKFVRENPLATQESIANKFDCSRRTVRRYLSVPTDIVEGKVTSAAKIGGTLAPETPEPAGASSSSVSSCSTSQKPTAPSHNPKTSQEAASKAFDVLLKFCNEQPRGYLDDVDGLALGRVKERLRT